MKLSAQRLTLLLFGWLVAINLLVWLAQRTGAWPAQALLFISLSLLPGAALLRALRTEPDSLLEGIVFSVGLSILLLMAGGFLLNEGLFRLGVARPLELAGIWVMLNVVTLGVIAGGAFVNRKPLWLSKLRPQPSLVTCLFAGTAALLPVLAAFGAFRLNNGGDGLVAVICLCLGALILAGALVWQRRLSDKALAWGIFSLGLSILLMTSLRSWDISGHDIMREFRVYTLTHVYGHWDIGAYRDPYNACLSITILPEVLAKLLRISGQTSFRLLLQIYFAVCPVVIYITLRRHVSKAAAVLGCGLFLSYPTFINDSAMLTRQGIAYLFFSLGLLAALHLPREEVYKPLFILCAAGVVLSHYSTSYMFVAMFGIALAGKLFIQRFRGWRLTLRGNKFTVLTPGIVAFLALGTFVWYGQFTGTSTGLFVTLQRSIANVPNLLSDDNKSADTSASLFLAAHHSQLDLYQSYLGRAKVAPDDSVEWLYQPQITADDIAVTPLGTRLNAFGIKPSITARSRQQFAKVLQLFAGLSVFYATYLGVFYTTYVFARRKASMLPLDLICLSMAGIFLLMAMVAMPNLSLSYGVLRTFQQSLIFLVIPLMIFLARLGRFLGKRFRMPVVVVGMGGLFFLFTGVIAQLLGGVSAPITLNNHGPYYGLYYTTAADLRGYDWMKAHIPSHRDVRAAGYAKAIMHDPAYPFDQVGILPSQRPKNAYAFLDQAQIVAQKFYVYHDGSPLITTFPLNYYHDQTNQIYSTTTTGIYR